MGEEYGVQNNVGTNTNSTPMIQMFDFLRSGYYDYSNGSLNNRGSLGYYWSRRSDSSAYGNYLGFGSTYVYPRNNGRRGSGFSVRCLGR